MNNIQEMAKEAFKEERSAFIFGNVLIWVLIVLFNPVTLKYSLYPAALKLDYKAEMMPLAIVLYGLVAIFLICAQIILIKNYIKVKKCVTQHTYTYHYLDIKEYTGTSNGHFSVTYYLNEHEYDAITSIYGAKKIHVFDCNGEHLTFIEEPKDKLQEEA